MVSRKSKSIAHLLSLFLALLIAVSFILSVLSEPMHIFSSHSDPYSNSNSNVVDRSLLQTDEATPKKFNSDHASKPADPYTLSTSELMSMRTEEPQYSEFDYDPDYTVVYNTKYPRASAPTTRNGFHAKSLRNIEQSDLYEKQLKISEQMLEKSGYKSGLNNKRVSIPDFANGNTETYPDMILDHLNPESLTYKLRNSVMENMMAEREVREDYYNRMQDLHDELENEILYAQEREQPPQQQWQEEADMGVDVASAPSSELAFDATVKGLGMEQIKVELQTTPTVIPSYAPTLKPTFVPTAATLPPTSRPTVSETKKSKWFVYIDQHLDRVLPTDDQFENGACTVKQCKSQYDLNSNVPVTCTANAVNANWVSKAPSAVLDVSQNPEGITGIDNIQERYFPSNNCTYRAAMAYCAYYVPWYTGRVESCTVVFRPWLSTSYYKNTPALTPTVHKIKSDVQIDIKKIRGRYPINIIVDGQNSKVEGANARFLTTHSGNDTRTNVMNFTQDQITIPEVILDQDLRRNLFDFNSVNSTSYSVDSNNADGFDGLPSAMMGRGRLSASTHSDSWTDPFGENGLYNGRRDTKSSYDKRRAMAYNDYSPEAYPEGLGDGEDEFLALTTDEKHEAMIRAHPIGQTPRSVGLFSHMETVRNSFSTFGQRRALSGRRRLSVPTPDPTFAPTEIPTFAPSANPTVAPTEIPTYAPSFAPTMSPSFVPTYAPTYVPTVPPTLSPTSREMIPNVRLALSSFTIKDLTIDKFVVGDGSSQNGGALRFAGIRDLILTNVKFTNCKGEFGGAVFVYDARDVTINLCTFESNRAVNNGGALFIYDARKVDITLSIFKLNSASNIGGAVAIDTLGAFSVQSTKFESNTAGLTDPPQTVFPRTSYGGAISLVRVHESAKIFALSTTQSSLRNQFISNTAAFGSAISMAAVNNATLEYNFFTTNDAKTAGTVYWLYESGMGDKETPAVHADYSAFFNAVKEKMKDSGKPFKIFEKFSVPINKGNSWSQNKFKNYGEKFATEPMSLVMSPYLMNMSNYSSFAFPVSTNASIYDYYGTVTRQWPGTVAKLFKPERKFIECSFNTDNAVIVGTDSVNISSGSALFNRFKLSCIPGGNMFIAISAKIDSSHFYYPQYMNQLKTTGKRFPFYSTRDVTGKGRVYFRSCINGEKYDFFTATRSTCSQCVRRYSFYFLGDPFETTKDKQGASSKKDFTAECDACPLQAKYCIGDQILLHPDTFRWRHNSTRIFECPLSGGCRGGNSTGYGSCTYGYEGAWCGVCSAGFYRSRSENTCKSCNGQSLNKFTFSDIAFFIMASLAVLIPLTMYILKRYFKSTEDEDAELKTELKKLKLDINDNSDKTRSIRDALLQVKTINKAKYASWMSRAKITLVTYQIVIQSPMTLQMDFPQAFTDFMKSLSMINLDFLKVIPVGCYNTWHFIENMAVTTLVPIGVLAFLFLLYLMQVIHVLLFERDSVNRRMEEMKLRIRYFSAFLLFTYLILPGFSSLIFETFACVNVDPMNEVHSRSNPQSLLRADFAVDCNSSLYKWGENWANWMVGVYPVGLPCIYLGLLFICRHEIVARDSLEKIRNASMIRGQVNLNPSKRQKPRRYYQRLSASIGFMYMAYEPKYWFWEFVEVTRRLLLTAVLSLAFSGSIAQVTISIAVSLIYIKIYNQYKPYVLQSEDSLAEMGQYQIFFTFFAASIMRQKSLGAYAELYVMMDYLLIVVNLFAIFLNIYYIINDIQDAIEVRKQVAAIGKLAQEDNFNIKTLQAITSKFTVSEEEKEKAEDMENEKKLEEQAKSEPIKLIKEKWRTNFDVSNKEDLRLFVEIVNNMSDDDIFRMQAMIYENIVRYDRKYDEKIWIYCHDPVFLGSLEEIKSSQPRENALMHAVPLRVDYGDGRNDDDEEGGIKSVPIPKYMKELLEMDDIGFDSTIFKGNSKLGAKEADVVKAEEAQKDDNVERKSNGSDDDSDNMADDIGYQRENKEEDEDDDLEQKHADDDDDQDGDDQDDYRRLLREHKTAEKDIFNVGDGKNEDSPDDMDSNLDGSRIRTKFSSQKVESKEQLDRDANALFGPVSDDDEEEDGKDEQNSSYIKRNNSDDHLDYDNVNIKSKNSNQSRKSFGDGNSSVSEMEAHDTNKIKRNMLKNKRAKRMAQGSDTSDGDTATDASASNMFTGPRNNGFMVADDDVLFEGDEDAERESHHSKEANQLPTALRSGQKVTVNIDDDEDADDDRSERSAVSGGLKKSGSGLRLMPGATSDNDSHYKFNANFLDSDGGGSDRARDDVRGRPPIPGKAKANTWADSDDNYNDIRGASKTAIGKASKKISVKVEDQSNHSDYSTEREIEILDSDRDRFSHVSNDNNNNNKQVGKPKSGW